MDLLEWVQKGHYLCHDEKKRLWGGIIMALQYLKRTYRQDGARLCTRSPPPYYSHKTTFSLVTFKTFTEKGAMGIRSRKNLQRIPKWVMLEETTGFGVVWSNLPAQAESSLSKLSRIVFRRFSNREEIPHPL
ncbi:hypothetical protein HGM15179_012725 [Zosterops borbonicus]|uniref:Uncharacterized protein n=1 Tax=Zosterops borbonicus TaxID=364589 RepID=A0A8K1G9B7_9PASS|nr:hypothetical protein HGM15179_012725 [Zosterops borbonicus]